MDRGDAVARFAYEVPSLDSYWRAIVLFGQNVASYKFALAGALLEIGAGSEVVSLDELALPFASRVAEHLRTHDKQGTFQQSRFLDACRAYNSGELDADGLRAKTVQLGFANVIDAFHVVDQAEVPERFFVDERKTGQASASQIAYVSCWMKGTAPTARGGGGALAVGGDSMGTQPSPAVADRGVRTRHQNARGASGGAPTSPGHERAKRLPEGPLLLLLYAHRHRQRLSDHLPGRPRIPVVGGTGDRRRTSRWSMEPRAGVRSMQQLARKSDRPPHLRYVEQLNMRNEYLITSYHPLRPTLMAQTGDQQQIGPRPSSGI